MYYIGTMSGTSADGVDVALLSTDGIDRIELQGGVYIRYTDELQQRICAAMSNIEAGQMALLARDITLMHANAVDSLLRQYKISAKEVGAIGFHGQTIRHMPEEKLTIQIGDAARLAHLTGIGVVHDFRSYDVAAGGQGAPLVPVFHRALAAKFAEQNVVFLNIGGVANITYVGLDGELLAWDVGPGNAPMDDLVKMETGQCYDLDGNIARQGKVVAAALQKLLGNSFFSQPWPKSLDRNQFDYSVLTGLSLPDKLATLSEFIVSAIELALRNLPRLPFKIIVCGGGMHNKNLMSMLRQAMQSMTSMRLISDFGVDGNLLEAYAFAYLAARSLQGLPISFPSTTGSPQPLCGGAFYRVSS